MDKPKKHSGAANRNRKREKEAEVAKYSQKIRILVFCTGAPEELEQLF